MDKAAGVCVQGCRRGTGPAGIKCLHTFIPVPVAPLLSVDDYQVRVIRQFLPAAPRRQRFECVHAHNETQGLLQIAAAQVNQGIDCIGYSAPFELHIVHDQLRVGL